MSKTVDLLQRLITFDSSNQQVANETIDYCKEWLEEHGLKSEILINNGYKMLICNVGEGRNRLILNGHVDVVSAKKEQFDPKIKNGNIYGRGSADMKAGVASFMVAMTELQHVDLGETSVQLQLVTDEEIGGHNCSAYLTEQGYLGNFVICAEPTQIGIGYQSKGILQFDIHLSGKSAHGSRPWEGENAIIKAYEVYEKIIDLPFSKESTEIFDGPSINLAKITGGDVYNKVPDECTLSIDIRFLPTQDKDDILRQIQGVTDGEIIEHMSGSSVKNKIDNPYIQNLVKEIKSVTGKKEVSIFGQHGFADTRYFSRFDVPSIEFGPSGGEWHGDGEYAVIESLDQYKDIIVAFGQEFS